MALRAAQAERVARRVLGVPVGHVEDRVVAGVPARLYRLDRQRRPLAVYLHGGGFVMGSLDSHDATCRRLAVEAGVHVLSVAYRLAPEHRAPAAIDDATAVTTWAAQHLDQLAGDTRTGLAVVGDSAGGTLALLTACRLRGHAAQQQVKAIVLAYPNADLTLSQPSVITKGTGYGLDHDDLAWFLDQWVPDRVARTSPALSPLHADFSGLPPTILVTCGHDPLRDEGDAVAERLRTAGVPLHHQREPALVHGFLGLTDESSAADAATTRLWASLRRLLHAAAA